MSLFSWKKVPVETVADVKLSDEKKAQIDAVVSSWADAKRGGRSFTADGKEAPLQIVTEEEVAYFVQAMEAEADRLDAEATELQRRRLAEIAEKDAQIASINREIEAAKAKVKAQEDEINRRAEARVKLLAIVKRMEPNLDATAIADEANIRREVVRRQLGDAEVNGRSEAYVDERFGALAARAAASDPFRDAMQGRDLTAAAPGRATDHAYSKMVADMTTAWQSNTKH